MARTWSALLPYNSLSVDCSGSGQYAVTGPFDGVPQVSADYGQTWSSVSGLGYANYYAVRISDDGQKVAAARNYDYLYLSSNGGASWTRQDALGTGPWACLAMSGNGQVLVAAHSSNPRSSRDGGATWTEHTELGTGAWNAAAASKDGTKLVIAKAGGSIHRSTDSGLTWTELASAGVRSWDELSISDDGTKIIAAVSTSDGLPYLSTDSGVTWAAASGLSQGYWTLASVSGDGSLLAVGMEGGYIYLSTDNGATWESSQPNTGTQNWSNGAISDDGSTVFGAATGGSGYVATAPVVPQFSITSISPSSGPTFGGTEVTITGTGFYALQSTNGYEGIYFGNTNAGLGTFVDETTYIVVAPPAAAAGDIFISVQTTNDYADYTPFTYTEDTLSVTSITPASGPVEGGTFVTITGTGFNQATVATLDGLSLTDHTVVSDTMITGVTPPNTAGFKTLAVNRP